MAYGIDRQSYGLKEGRLKIGTWTPGSITTSNPLASFATPEDLGDFQQGSMGAELNRQYAEFLVGTPAIMSRKDLIRKQFTFTATFAQFSTDLMQLVQGLQTVSGTYSISYVGTDEETQDFNGYLIQTELVGGNEFYIAMWYGKVTSEAVGPTFPGTAHATYEFKAEAFPHPYFVTTSPNDIRNLGAFILGPVIS